MMQAFVLVSGLPASGKTTLAVALATSLRLPLFDKDSFLEALFQSVGTGTVELRRALSKRADLEFCQAAAATHSAVLTSWWKHPQSTVDSGTPTAWLDLAPRVLVEVHCACRASVAAARFLARTRHPGHLDQQRSPTLLAMFEQQEGLGPLYPSRVITVNTEKVIDLPSLTRAVQAGLCDEDDA